MKVSESQWPFVDWLQSCFGNQRTQSTWLDVAVPMEQAEYSSGLVSRSFEVNHEPSPAGCQNATYFTRAFTACFGPR